MKTGYWWYRDDEQDSIYFVTSDNEVTDGAFIYDLGEFDGEWVPVTTPEEVGVLLERIEELKVERDRLRQELEQARGEERDRIESAWELVFEYDNNIAESGLWYAVVEALVERIEKLEEEAAAAQAKLDKVLELIGSTPNAPPSYDSINDAIIEACGVIESDDDWQYLDAALERARAEGAELAYNVINRLEHTTPHMNICDAVRQEMEQIRKERRGQ
jgi:uncharacterized protein (UPF0335 family)